MNLFGKIKLLIGSLVVVCVVLVVAYFNHMEKFVQILMVVLPIQALLVLIFASILMNGYKHELLKANAVLKKWQMGICIIVLLTLIKPTII